jgi:pimeloyl-ACP methyl ester carboxylesterase
VVLRAWLAIAIVGCATAPPRAPDPALRALSARPDEADLAIGALVAEDFAAVERAFDPASDPPSVARIREVWAAKTSGLGPVTSWKRVDRTFQDGYDTRIVIVTLARGELECLVSIAPQTQHVASIFITRPAPPAPYVDRGSFHEVELSVGRAPFVLGATVLVPAGAGPFPAAVLIHGSGPNDRDETVGSNKIFRDIAEGLASHGIAVLRYDKRTYAYRDRLDNTITLEDEVMVDAVDAVRALAARPEVDPDRVFVIGHSLGGLLAPDIALRAQRVAGVALLAPPARPPWDIVRDQMSYLHAPRETRIAIERAIVELQLGLDPQTEILGMPASYWREWASHDGVAAARKLGRPVLVMHGDRDYQVTDDDFAIWRRALGTSATATFDGDNHLFIRGSGAPGPLEYKVPGHVDPRVIERLIDWIVDRRHRRGRRT